MQTRSSSSLRLAAASGVFLFSSLAIGDARQAQAAETSLMLGEIAPPPANTGIDRATLKTTAETELRGVDASRLRKRRNVLVSVAVGGASQAPFSCKVNALLRDAKTGTMLAILEGSARADGAADPELRQKVLRAAVRSALRQIPDALAAN